MGFDSSIIQFLSEHMRSPILDPFMIFMTRIGEGGGVWFIVSILMMFNRRYRRVGKAMFYALILGVILGEVILKNVVHRIRPFTAMPNLQIIIDRPLSYSFPSVHTTASFIAISAAIKMISNKLLKISTIILGCLITFSRLYLLVHYPTDILGGMLLGILCFCIIYAAVDRPLRNKFNMREF